MRVRVDTWHDGRLHERGETVDLHPDFDSLALSDDKGQWATLTCEGGVWVFRVRVENPRPVRRSR